MIASVILCFSHFIKTGFTGLFTVNFLIEADDCLQFLSAVSVISVVQYSSTITVHPRVVHHQTWKPFVYVCFLE